ncbi:uncharacterized protein LOC141661409 isoform X3 [Apium graveolens]|uniref:uncharacterized protein LOC141661409 isoform X3 n=1 Tax=Apium graveolens TaxID=4045 RepID=UPI003D7A0D79
MHRLESSQKSLVIQNRLQLVVDNTESDIQKNDAHDNSCMFPVNTGVDIAVDNDDKIGLEIKDNDEGKIGAEIGVDVEGKTRVEIRVDDEVPKDALDNVLADFSTGGVQEGVLYESGQFISDDFSPNTMEKIESVINKIEQDYKVAAIVSEVEVVTKGCEVGEKVLIVETVDDSNLQVDCEVGEVYLPSEKTDSVKNASKMVNDIDMKDAGVYKSKVFCCEVLIKFKTDHGA